MRLQIFFLTILVAIFFGYSSDAAALNKTIWDEDNNYKLNDTSSSYDGNSYGGDQYNNSYDSQRYDTDQDDDQEYSDDEEDDPTESRSSRTRKSPDEYGNINFYFREPSKRDTQKKYKRIRFPVHRYERRHSPRFPSLISFLPWLPIFADRVTKQTIIYSPTGGIYIIPPVINFYGKMYSIAELIASGYVSLVSSGAPPPPAINVAPLVKPGGVTGPGIPPPDPSTGGFKGGVRTKFPSFPRPKYPRGVEEEGDYERPKKNYGY